MTVTMVESAQIAGPRMGYYVLTFSRTPADTGPRAALTSELADLPSPRNQLAIIISGRVIAHPAVISPITRGQVRISGFATHAQAERLLRSLRG
jgi:preprotein translocase subunit SecD